MYLDNFLFSTFIKWTLWITILYTFVITILNIAKSYWNIDEFLLDKFVQHIENNDDIKCIALINKHPSIINKYHKSGYTPFLLSCLTAKMMLIKLMLEKGADVNLKSTRCESPIYLTCFYHVSNQNYKNAVVLRELYYAGANINTPNDKGLTPLQMAAIFGHTSLVKWLLTKNASTTNIPSPYFLALTHGHYATVHVILKHSNSKRLPINDNNNNNNNN